MKIRTKSALERTKRIYQYGIKGVLCLGLVAGGFLWLTTGRGGAPVRVPAYTVLRVTDGDTFETAEHQYIRLASTEAPPLERCGGPEAKKALEKLVLGRSV